MTFTRISLPLLALAAILCGCRKPTSANWNVDALVPVVNSSLNIRNFLGDTLFIKDQSGLLHLVYDREITSLKLDSLLEIPDTTISKAFVNEFFLPVDLKPGDKIPITPVDLTFDFGNGIQLKRTDIRSGTLFVKFSNDVSENMDLVYLLPGVTKNGQPFTIKETIPPGKNSLSKSYSLDGYSMNMQGEKGNTFNTIFQTFSLSLSANSNSVSVQPNQGAAVEVTYSNVVPEFVLGYFGQQEVDLSADTTFVDLVEKVKAPNFELSSATMDFTFINEFGVDFSGSVSNVKSINTVNNKTVTLNNSVLSTININRATRSGSMIFPSTKTISLNSGNSNLAAFISNLPNKISYEGSVKMNPVPPGNISGYNDFAFYNTGIRILANIDIPLRFRGDTIQLFSSAKVDFSENKQLDNVNHGEFVVYASNGFPFQAQVQGYMVDEANNLLDSIFIQGANTIASGQVDAQNFVIAPTSSVLHIPVDRAKIENLKKTRQIKIVSYFILPPNTLEVSLMDNYTLDLKIVAEVNYNVGLSNN